MNILYINHYAGSPEMGMEFRPYYLAREWVRMGHQVSIIAGDYSHLRNKNPIVSKDMDCEIIDGINYYWIKTGTYEGNGAARAFTMLRFCHKLKKWKGWINSHLKPDVVISSSTYPIDSLPSYQIARGGGISSRYIHEVHDMWPATPIELGGMSKLNPFIVMMQFGENYAYRHADAVVSLPKYASEYMQQHGLEADKFHYIPNGVVTDEWDNPEPLPDEHLKVLENLKQQGKFIVGYFGGHALSNCLMPLVKSAESINEADVHYVLVGDGVEKRSLMDYANGFSNITFLPPVDKQSIPTLIKYFDCTYIGAKKSPLYRFGACMNKMFDGMMGGMPIIFGIEAPPTPVEECGCGIIIPPEDVAAINKAITSLKQMPKPEREKMGKRGKEYILSFFSYQKLAEDFINVMK